MNESSLILTPTGIQILFSRVSKWITLRTFFSVCLLLEEEDNQNQVLSFEASFMIDFLNWREDKENLQQTIEFNSCMNLLTKTDSKDHKVSSPVTIL